MSDENFNLNKKDPSRDPIMRLDHSQIKDGQSIYGGMTYEGKKLIGPAPMKKYESIEKYREEFKNVSEEKPQHLKGAAKDLSEILDKSPDDFLLFHNELNEAFARVRIGTHWEILSCNSKNFKSWLLKTTWDEKKKPFNQNALKNLHDIIYGKAIFDGEEYTLSNRIAVQQDSLFYDLSDQKWRAVKITSKGWEVIEKAPILFRRYKHQRAQVEPVPDGDIRLILPLVNVGQENQKLLLLVWIVSCFIPNFPHPVLNVHGPQGSAKSLLFKLLKRLIDPSAMEVATVPHDKNEFAQLLSHHWCIFFDNISKVSDSSSDILCKAVTGEGLSKRALYTDDEDMIYAFTRCIAINGINLTTMNPDLLERSILFPLERVEPNNRKQEKDILEKFEQEKAQILGGVFNTLAEAMKIHPLIKISSLPRMADFAVWGCAIAQALGYAKEEFLNAYLGNISHQNEEVLSESPVALTIQELISKQDVWEGTQSTLLRELDAIAEGLNINTQEKEWPRAANALSRLLNTLKTNLEMAGIKVERHQTSRARFIRISRIPSTKDLQNIQQTDVKAINDDDDIPRDLFTHDTEENV